MRRYEQTQFIKWHHNWSNFESNFNFLSVTFYVTQNLKYILYNKHLNSLFVNNVSQKFGNWRNWNNTTFSKILLEQFDFYCRGTFRRHRTEKKMIFEWVVSEIFYWFWDTDIFYLCEWHLRKLNFKCLSVDSSKQYSLLSWVFCFRQASVANGMCVIINFSIFLKL